MKLEKLIVGTVVGLLVIAMIFILSFTSNKGYVPIISATSSLDFTSTGTGLSSDLTITLTGAALNDVVVLGVPNVSVNTNSCYTAWVSATNTVTVRFNNYSSLSIDPATGTFRVAIIKL